MFPPMHRLTERPAPYFAGGGGHPSRGGGHVPAPSVSLGGGGPGRRDVVARLAHPWSHAALSPEDPNVRRRSLPARLALAAALLAALAAPAAPARADGGMWMPKQIPDLAPRLRELGFEGDPRAFADLTGQPMGAVVSLGGCSASFVSPDGLLATNHHCIQAALQYNSTPQRNLLEDGYVARTRAEELWNGPGSRVYVTVSFKDVTSAVTGGIDPKLADAARARLIEKRVKQETARCERSGLRCTVASFFEGAAYYAIGQLELEDVRLVYSPQNNVGNFGGETDNWMWPRHSGDFALYRAYVGRNGKPAAHAKDNVPYRPARFLKVSPAGASEGDLVLVAGYPGRTYRLRTAEEVRHLLEWSYPRTARRYAERLELLAELSKGSPETAIKVNSLVRGYANTKKNFEGVMAGARKDGLLAKKAAAEQELAAWIAADPRRQAEYGDVLAGLAAIQRGRAATRERDAAFYALHLAGATIPATRPASLLSAARTLLRLGEERKKRDADRDPEFQQRNWGRIREGMERLDKALDLRADRALLRHAAREAAALPEGQRIGPLDAAAGLAPGLAPAEADARIDAWLEKLYAGTRLQDRAVRVSLLDRSAKQLSLVDDAFLRLAAALAPFERQLEEEAHARDGARSRVAPRYARALLEKAGGLVAPDANSTLRVTYGKVQGVSPRDGLRYLAQTTLAGVAAKHRPGDEEFDVPEPVREAIARQQARKDGGPFVDAKLGDVPVNFLSDVDTTGGNSGSAVMNGRGELVGLLFDGTYETIASDFLFDPEKTRSIAVDSRYLLWSLVEVAKASHLVDELGVRPQAAAADRAQ